MGSKARIALFLCFNLVVLAFVSSHSEEYERESRDGHKKPHDSSNKGKHSHHHDSAPILGLPADILPAEATILGVHEGLGDGHSNLFDLSRGFEERSHKLHQHSSTGNADRSETQNSGQPFGNGNGSGNMNGNGGQTSSNGNTNGNGVQNTLPPSLNGNGIQNFFQPLLNGNTNGNGKNSKSNSKTTSLLPAVILPLASTFFKHQHKPKPSCNFLNLGVCADLLNGVAGVEVGDIPKTPCCTLIKGLADLEAAVCLCTAIKANVLGILDLRLPISLTVLLNNCGKNVPADYQCHQ